MPSAGNHNDPRAAYTLSQQIGLLTLKDVLVADKYQRWDCDVLEPVYRRT